MRHALLLVVAIVKELDLPASELVLEQFSLSVKFGRRLSRLRAKGLKAWTAITWQRCASSSGAPSQLMR